MTATAVAAADPGRCPWCRKPSGDPTCDRVAHEQFDRASETKIRQVASRPAFPSSKGATR